MMVPVKSINLEPQQEGLEPQDFDFSLSKKIARLVKYPSKQAIPLA
jgi:hypothetical protein